MLLKLVYIAFVLLKIQESYSLDVTSEQLLARIAALERKDAEQSKINTRLLAMVDNNQQELKKKDATIQQILKQVSILQQKDTSHQQLQKEISNLQSRVVAMETKMFILTAKCQGQLKNGHTDEPTPILHSNDKNNILSGFLNAIVTKGSNASNDEVANLAVQSNDKQSVDEILKVGNQNKRSHNIRQTSYGPEMVAFHAVSDHYEIPHVGVNQNIVFETVLLNLASGYHNQHGVFIAPSNGLYLFSTSILADNNGNKVYTELVKNGAVLARVLAHGDTNKYNQGSVTVVTQLNASDEVWVRLYCCADDTLYGGRYTSFTGVMLTAL